MAKAPSPIAIAVITLVGFIGPKKVSNPIANFSMAAVTKTGARIVRAYALYTISAPTTKISIPQCRSDLRRPYGFGHSQPSTESRPWEDQRSSVRIRLPALWISDFRSVFAEATRTGSRFAIALS